MERIELSIHACKAHVFPLALHPHKIWSVWMDLNHRPLSSKPSRLTRLTLHTDGGTTLWIRYLTFSSASHIITFTFIHCYYYTQDFILVRQIWHPATDLNRNQQFWRLSCYLYTSENLSNIFFRLPVWIEPIFSSICVLLRSLECRNVVWIKIIN